MIMTFKTKRDTNGNTYYLDIDTEKKTYTADYNRYFAPDFTPIVIGKRDRHRMMDYLDENGYTREV